MELRTISPIDGSVYATRPVADLDTARAAFARARAAQRDWAARPLAERATACHAMVEAMLAMETEIVPELAWQMGRPVRYGSGEMRGFAERARYMIAIAEDALSPLLPEEKQGFKRYIERVPLGVVFVLAPWNFPYLTSVNAVIPALMAGNAVVLKHADQTMLVGERFAMAADQTLPEGLFAHLVLGHDQVGQLIADGVADQVNFTGSVAGGQAVERAAAGTFTPVGLELGGKDAAYVLPDADPQAVAAALLDGAFFNSGQSCCAIERIYAHADIHDDLVEAMAAVAKSDYVLDNPLQSETTLGPLIRTRAAEFVRGQIAEATADGALALLDPGQWQADAPGSPYLAPQILTQVTHEMGVMRDESFGPVVGVMKVDSDNTAIAAMNDSAFGLTGSVWGQDIERAEALCRRIEAGTVFVNRCDYLDPALAWTGIKQSGRGATLSRIGYETLTRPKSFHIRETL